MKSWKRMAALSSAIVMAAATLTYFPSDTLQNIRLEISASAETTTEPQVWIEDNLTWTLDADGKLTISGTGAMKDYSSSEGNRSPAHNNSNVKKVVIEDGVTSIGNQAFPFCQKLASVTIPDSVTSIENYAFSECSSLTDIVIPNSVTSIGNSVFKRCSNLSNITLSNNITSIGSGAFTDCRSLPSITIPDSVTSIGGNAFSDCRSLTSITIPDKVTSIEYAAFDGCSRLTSITIPDSITSIGDFAFRYCKSLPSITIPDSVTSIGNSAFFDCSSLTSITIPDSVTSIGNSAFRYCKNLPSITIPDSVTSIGTEVFQECTSLQTISLSCKSTLKKSDFGEQADSVSSLHILKKTETKDATCTEDGNKEYWTCEHCGKYFLSDDTDPETATAVELSETVTPAIQHKNAIIRDISEPTETAPGYSGDRYCPDCNTVLEKGYTYWNEDNLTWRLYEDGTLNISGTGAMKDYDDYLSDGNRSPVDSNSKIKKVVIEKGVTNIGNYAFSRCWGLKSIKIPDGVTSIGDHAFDSCINLRSITLPDSITSIGMWAFYNCWNVPSIIIPDGVTSIEDFTFNSCISLTSITIPNSVTKIKSSAFHNCADLTSITIPDSVTSIGDSVFSDCNSLKTISLSCGSVLKKSDFGEQANLVSYTNQHALIKTAAKAETCTEDGNKEYWTCEHCGKYFLSDDTNPETATAVELSETVISALKHKNTTTRGASEPTETEPGYSGDRYCPDCNTVLEKGYTYWIEDNLTWKLYADGTLNISGTGAMKDYNSDDNRSPVYNNSNVKKIVVEKGVTSIGKYAFYICKSLTSITIPDSVTSIGDASFRSCSNLTSITLPDSVTSIGDYAFGFCVGLSSITIPDSVTNIGEHAFSSCSSLTSITIPDSVTSIGDSAFYNCSSLTSITIPDSVTSIGDWTFYKCSSLTNITIPDGVTSIGYDAFHACSSLSSITIPDSVTSIEPYAFFDCWNLTSITIPDSVTRIGDYAFENCSSLQTISLSCKSSLKKSDFGNQADLVSASHTLKKTEAKAATCTEDGNKEYWTCEHCGKYFLSDDTDPETATAVEQSETIISASHKLTKVEAKAATYDENGNKEYWTCEHCGKYFLSDDTNPETAKAVELSETVIPALVQVATATTPIKCVYGQDMNEIDLRDYVKNTDVVGEVSVKVAAGSTLPDGMKLDGSKLFGKPAKAYEDGKEVTFTFTAENGNTADLTLLFLVEKADPTVEVVVSGDSHTEGDLVDELELILSENSTKGVVKIVSEIKALVAGKNTLTWKFTPEDENNYNMVTGTVVVNAQTTTTTTTTTKATTTTKPNTTTTSKTTATTKTNTTTTTKTTVTTKPNTTTTTKTTATTKPNTTTTTKATVTTKPNTTTTSKTTVTTKPGTTTTSKTTATTKPDTTTTSKITVTTNKTTSSAMTTKTTTMSSTVTTTNTTAPSYGDINLDGKVDIVDAIFLNKYLATLIQFSDAQVANADCYQDGVLNDQDATALMQFIVLLIDDLPTQPDQK